MKYLGLDLAHLPVFLIGGGGGIFLAGQLPIKWTLLQIPIGALILVLWPLILFLGLRAISFWFPRGFLIQWAERLFRAKKYTPFEKQP